MADLRLTYYSDVKNDKLQENIRNKIAEDLSQFNNKRIEITIQQVKGKRSEQQNKYYWGCVVAYQQDCFKEMWGALFTKDQVHDWNKANIFCEEKIDEEGVVYKIPGKSSVKTTSEFEDRMELIRQFFKTHFDWKIPLPNEEIEIGFNE